MHKAFSELFEPDSLRLAWERCVRARQHAAKDYRGLAAFNGALRENLDELSQEMLSGRLRPVRPPKFYMPKGSGMQRTITRLHVDDALVYQAIADASAAAAYEELSSRREFVFANVLLPDVAHGTEVLRQPRGEYWFFERWLPNWNRYQEHLVGAYEAQSESDTLFEFATDITGFFDTIPHSLLLDRLEAIGLPQQALDWLRDALNVWSGTRDGATPGVGIPQGPEPSDLLAEIFLQDLDQRMVAEGLFYFRYVDDIRVLSEDRDVLQRTLLEIDRWLKTNGLSLNAKKTEIEQVDRSNTAEFEQFVDYGGQEADVWQAGFPSEEASGSESRIGSGVREREFLDQVEHGIEELLPRWLTDEDDIIEFAEQVLADAHDNLSALGLIAAGDEQGSEVASREFSKQLKSRLSLAGKQTRDALHVFRDKGEHLPAIANEVLHGWERAANQDWAISVLNAILWTLAAFAPDQRAKQMLLRFAEKWGDYEWVEAEVLRQLGRFEFTDVELRAHVLPRVGEDSDRSWLPKLAAYDLLDLRLGNAQLRATVAARRRAERDGVLRRELALQEASRASEAEVRRIFEEYEVR